MPNVRALIDDETNIKIKLYMLRQNITNKDKAIALILKKVDIDNEMFSTVEDYQNGRIDIRE